MFLFFEPIGSLLCFCIVRDRVSEVDADPFNVSCSKLGIGIGFGLGLGLGQGLGLVG